MTSLWGLSRRAGTPSPSISRRSLPNAPLSSISSGMTRKTSRGRGIPCTVVAIATTVSIWRRTGRCTSQPSMLHSKRHSMRRPVSIMLTSSRSHPLTPSICSSRVCMAYRSLIKSPKPTLPLKKRLMPQLKVMGWWVSRNGSRSWVLDSMTTSCSIKAWQVLLRPKRRKHQLPRRQSSQARTKKKPLP